MYPGMAINCRIANLLIAIRFDRLTGYSYQNTQIFDKLWLFLIIVINNTEKTIGKFCNQNII